MKKRETHILLSASRLKPYGGKYELNLPVLLINEDEENVKRLLGECGWDLVKQLREKRNE